MQPTGIGRRQVLRSMRPGAVPRGRIRIAVAYAAIAADGRNLFEGRRDRDNRVNGSDVDRKSLSRKTHPTTARRNRSHCANASARMPAAEVALVAEDPHTAAPEPPAARPEDPNGPRAKTAELKPAVAQSNGSASAQGVESAADFNADPGTASTAMAEGRGEFIHGSSDRSIDGGDRTDHIRSSGQSRCGER